MSELKFETSQIVVIEEKLSRNEVLKKLADVLEQKGIVKDTYFSAIIEREDKFPTGLDVQGINVAIPHCDVVNVNEGGLCVGILKKGSHFAKMDDPDIEIEVNMVVMLALTEPHGHIEMLQKIIALIQDQDLLNMIVTSNNVDEIFGLCKDKLL